MSAPSDIRADRRGSPVQRDPVVGRRPEADAQRMAWALFPVRLFLGLTFVYAGIQKLSDPGFLHAGAPTYIGTQLRGFANGTPGGFLLRAFALPHPALAGVGVALVEIAVGLLVTTGLITRAAASVGLLLNLVLFLTNSWHTYPYFLGSDIVFVFAWLPFVVVGASRQPTLESLVRRFPVAPTGTGRQPGRLIDGRGAPRTARASSEAELTRRGAIAAALGVVTAATAAIAGLSLLLRGSYRPARKLSASASARTTSHKTQTSAQAHPEAPGASKGLPSGAVRLGAASQLPAGQGATYRDPGDGQLDIVIRQSSGSLVAHSAICTHAGCAVDYQGGQIVCPCHGSIFDAQTGAVISGPAPTPLASRKVLERAGGIYAVPA
jgi:thiosulfate dehydrogenase [quinone] large subunit